MGITCIVVGCRSRFNRDNVRFFRVPAELHHRFLTEKNELSKRRRALWLAAIKRRDLTESKIKYQKVCSRHFITGEPSALEDVYNPDWIPTQFMECTSLSVDKPPSEKETRLKKRRKLQDAEGPAEKVQNEDIQEQEVENDTGIFSKSTQTDLTMEDLEIKEEQLEIALKIIHSLTVKTEKSPE